MSCLSGTLVSSLHESAPAFFFFFVLFFVCFLVETWVSDMPKNIGRSSIFVLSFKLFFTVLIFMLHIVEDDSSQPVNAL